MTARGESYAVDPTDAAAGWVGWAGMGARERWGAVLLAMRSGYPLEPSGFAYHPRLDLVAVVRPSRLDASRRQVVHRRATSAEEARTEVAMFFGARGIRDAEAVVRGRRGLGPGEAVLVALVAMAALGSIWVALGIW